MRYQVVNLLISKGELTKGKTTVDDLIIKKDITEAEIIWALDCIKKHRSFHSSDDQGEIFRAMFKDSQIARSYKMCEDKLAYLTTYGLAPHFHLETKARL